MFRDIGIPASSTCEKRRMTLDMATTGFDNLVMKYWELWSGYGWICKDIAYSMHNSNKEAVLMAVRFRDKHMLRENEMIIDVQGFGFLRECFPRAQQFAGAGTPSNRGKAQFKSAKDEAGHLAMEMIQSGLVHYDSRLADMRYNHKNMKREGGTTIMRHMVFESKIFQFRKTPNGRISMLDKGQMKTYLKGMSPDLFDNVILLCGGTCYDCHRMLREDAGIMRKKMQSEDMLQLLNLDVTSENDDMRYRKKKIRNAGNILLKLSMI